MYTVHDRILRVLQFSPMPLSVEEIAQHELLRGLNDGKGVSANNIATRMSDAPLKGKVWSAVKEGAHYKLWWDRPWTRQHFHDQAYTMGTLVEVPIDRPGAFL